MREQERGRERGLGVLPRRRQDGPPGARRVVVDASNPVLCQAWSAVVFRRTGPPDEQTVSMKAITSAPVTLARPAFCSRLGTRLNPTAGIRRVLDLGPPARETIARPRRGAQLTQQVRDDLGRDAMEGGQGIGVLGAVLALRPKLPQPGLPPLGDGGLGDQAPEHLAGRPGRASAPARRRPRPARPAARADRGPAGPAAGLDPEAEEPLSAKLPTCDREPLGCHLDEPPTNSTKPAGTVPATGADRVKSVFSPTTSTGPLSSRKLCSLAFSTWAGGLRMAVRIFFQLAPHPVDIVMFSEIEIDPRGLASSLRCARS